MVEGMCGGGRHGRGVCVAGGHTWQGVQRALQRAVHILLECILVRVKVYENNIPLTAFSCVK